MVSGYSVQSVFYENNLHTGIEYASKCVYHKILCQFSTEFLIFWCVEIFISKYALYRKYYYCFVLTITLFCVVIKVIIDIRG